MDAADRGRRRRSRPCQRLARRSDPGSHHLPDAQAHASADQLSDRVSDQHSDPGSDHHSDLASDQLSNLVSDQLSNLFSDERSDLLPHPQLDFTGEGGIRAFLKLRYEGVALGEARSASPREKRGAT